MQSYKKILIILIIVFFTVIIWHLIMQRIDILKKIKVNHIEGFTLFNTPDNELTSVKNVSPVRIQNLNSTYLNQPIRQFCIKSSYNTAVTGKFVNKDMIKYALSKGYRYLDFEIFLINNVPSVAYTTDPNYEIIDTDNSIPLSSAFNTVIVNAFSGTSPNKTDPLFINLRIKSNDTSVYKAVANTIYNALLPKLYSEKVTNETKMEDIMGQIVLIMDRTVAPNYVKYCKCQDENCQDLTNYINMESGTSVLYQTRYSEILNQSSIQINTLLDICSICTDIRHMRVVLPDNDYKSTSNPNIDKFITDYGAQIVPYRLYSNDGGLRQYEALFDYQKHRSAFVPLTNAISYIQELNAYN